VNNLVPFTFDEREVRTLIINGEPWFVAADLCAILGFVNSRKAVSDHVDSEDKGVTKRDTLGGAQRFTIVNESGLYALIFGSTLQENKRFKRWVTTEVLPQIRKTGKFQVDVRGWLSTGPKPWTKTFPDRYYSEIFRLHGKAPDRQKEREPWLAQLTTFLIYNRIEQGVRETLNRINPVPAGKRWRSRKLHQHIAPGEAEQQFRTLLGECVGALSVAEDWDQFLSVWNSMHPLVEALPPGVEAVLSDGQLWLFNFLNPETSK
jgi:hypothetical protein